MAFPHRLDAPELPDFSMLKRLARDQLIYLLEQLPGKKDLFIEADLMSPLDRIANVSILKQHEVDKLYKVENKPALSANEQLCFLVRPRIKNMRYIATLLEGFNIRESTSYIEEHIDRQVSPIESLRLMCLLSITENGLIPKDYRSLKTQYLQSYGPEHLLTFSNLRRAGLLTEQAPGDTLTAVESKVSKLVTDKAAGKITDAFSSLAKRSNFRAISKKLNLIPRVDGEYDLKVPRDMAYVFSGAYVPLSCRIIEQVLDRRSWQGLDEVVRLLNCNTAKEDKASSESLRLILVVFLGGCTFSEISALRFLGREKGYRFIFLTTAVTNSARLMEAMSEVKS